jgi:hypothetical protein
MHKVGFDKRRTSKEGGELGREEKREVHSNLISPTLVYTTPSTL